MPHQQEELLPWERYSPSKAVAIAVAVVAEDVDCREDEEEGGIGIHILRKFAPDMLQILGTTWGQSKFCGHWNPRGGRKVFQYIGLKKSFKGFFARHALNGGIGIGGDAIKE